MKVEHRPDGANELGSPCPDCLFFLQEAESAREHCFRFARFVDHVLCETSRHCEYWAPAFRPAP